MGNGVESNLSVKDDFIVHGMRQSSPVIARPAALASPGSMVEL